MAHKKYRPKHRVWLLWEEMRFQWYSLQLYCMKHQKKVSTNSFVGAAGLAIILLGLCAGTMM